MKDVPENTKFELDAEKLQSRLNNTPLAPWCDALVQAVSDRKLHHGDLPRWQAAFDALPKLTITKTDLDHPLGVCAMTAEDIAELTTKSHDVINNDASSNDANSNDANSDDANNNDASRYPSDYSSNYPTSEAAERLEPALKGLKPWRKGPYRLAHVTVDTEWHSDWKWNRVRPHISDLTGRTVLDVGCGNGYHMWRMRSAGAKHVLGVDPSILFSLQFQAVEKYIEDVNINLLPLTMEALPINMHAFDTVFSMGVLYHRQDPQAHLKELLQAVKPGGELVLETLVTLGEDATTLNIDGRYARMRNIWSLPTVPMLANWIKQSGFTNIRFVSLDTTSRLEQRTTEWMPFESLTESLDPEDMSLTVEGLPRPRRAVMIADAPSRS